MGRTDADGLSNIALNKVSVTFFQTKDAPAQYVGFCSLSILDYSSCGPLLKLSLVDMYIECFDNDWTTPIRALSTEKNSQELV